jgi:hypothetical protein
VWKPLGKASLRKQGRRRESYIKIEVREEAYEAANYIALVQVPV